MVKGDIDGLPVLQFEGLSRAERLVHFCTTRAGGVSSPPFGAMNLGLSRGGETESKVCENWNRVARAAGVTSSHLFSMTQCHGANVAVVDQTAAGDREKVFLAGNLMNVLPNVDAVVTAATGLCLCAMGADCPGLILYSQDPPALGLIHSGWRGTCRNIAVAALKTMILHFGVDPAKMSAGIGPGISADRYEVGPEVISAFTRLDDGTYGLGKNVINGRKIDLAGIIHSQLESAGVRDIEKSGLCTWNDNDVLYSYRLEGPISGRFCLAGSLL